MIGNAIKDITFRRLSDAQSLKNTLIQKLKVSQYQTCQINSGLNQGAMAIMHPVYMNSIISNMEFMGEIESIEIANTMLHEKIMKPDQAPNQYKKCSDLFEIEDESFIETYNLYEELDRLMDLELTE